MVMTLIREQLVAQIEQLDKKRLFQKVAAGTELEEFLQHRTTLNACFILLLERSAQSESEYFQTVTERYQVISIASMLRNSGNLLDDMQAVIFKALSGFSPVIDGEKTNPVHFEQGKLIELENGRGIWSDIYSLNYTVAINQQ